MQASHLSPAPSGSAAGKPHIVTKEPPAIVAEAHKILRETSAALPRSIGGLERQMMIGDVVSRMDEVVRDKLRGLMNHFLTRMLNMSASDIDLGGYGTQGQIWYSIHGVKRPDPTHGVFTPDEMNILVQALIGDRQRNFLFENRNLDFSHMLYLENGEFRFESAPMRSTWTRSRPTCERSTTRSEHSSFLSSTPTRKTVLSLAHTKDGLCLVTGITGSGKSTTHDTILDANNHSVDAHVVIIAAPVEYDSPDAAPTPRSA